MATRNILDSIGNVIGTLTLSDTAPESDWTAALSSYVTPPAAPSSGLNLQTYTVSGSGATTTSSANAATVGTMTHTPMAGVYSASFSGSIFTDGASAQGEFGIYVDGVLLPETRRDIKCNLTLLGGLVSISLNAIGVGTNTQTEIRLDGSQVIDVRFKSNNGGTIGFNERVFTLTRLR